ncbi:MAG TPA: MarR family transcriptional regulator [Gemmatimonadaceae bacterium]|jgi:hypothetical protein|nr:MarR family transcriptional regulator [Gemmatimonadaceae bacterium]
MSDPSLPEEVRRLIDGALASMDHVEVLFRIARQGDATAGWLARDAHIEPSHVAKVLRDLEHAKLIVSDGESYHLTQNPRDRAAVEEFAATYNSRPVTLIRAIYARPSPLRSFADAFRVRRED